MTESTDTKKATAIALPYTMEQMQAVVDEIDKQSDRGAALIAAAVMDNFLEHLITARLVELPRKTRKAIFGLNGPLSSFSSKIDFGFALGLFNEERKRSLHFIRNVRNKFAHNMEPITFDHPDISTIVASSVTAEVNAYTTMTSRQKFLLTANFLNVYLCISASSPHIRIGTIENNSHFLEGFSEILAVTLHVAFEKKNFNFKPSSSEALKQNLLKLPPVFREVFEYQCYKLSSTLPKITHNCKPIYDDGLFILCKDQNGTYELRPTSTQPDA